MTRASGSSPFAPGCNVSTLGTVYPNSEVEPYVASNPVDTNDLVGVWQQDRWSSAAAQGQLTAVSSDRGSTWTLPAPPPFSHCQGGNATNGGDYDRTSDPWVTFGPTGDSYQSSLAVSNDQVTSAILVSKSSDHGQTWGPIATLRRDDDPHFLNDKESITADSLAPNRAYAVWDRLFALDPTNPNSDFFGPIWFARTTNGGATWRRAHKIFDPGLDNQTIGNQIVELPDGELLDVFDLIIQGNLNVALIRSPDQGRTWSQPTIVDQEASIGVVDPMDAAPVRTGDIIPEVAVDPRPGTNNVYLVWQDARFSAGHADQVVFTSSSDGGRTWTPVTRISQDGILQAFTPMITVAGNGDIAVTYYDFSFDTPASPTLDTDYWVTRSTDGGATFQPRERITPTSFDMRTAPVARGFFVGDYEGLAPSAQFSPFFAAANSGDLSNPTDVFSTLVHAPFPTAAATVRRPRAHRAKFARRSPGHIAASRRPVRVR
ncbi:MAG TPA: sialidase family protein [Thermoleophilaceae bacterium]